MEQAAAIWEKSNGPGHPQVATGLNGLAEVLRAQVGCCAPNPEMATVAQGLYQQAKPLYERAISIWEKALGPDHPEVAAGLNNLGELFRGQVNF